ncbi:MAG: six-cysteine ranthipeptide SCIFF [Eubacteriales bacterium]|nr:six-cysteine ranthipeptide SCIFF [Eubacteriales bacterium]
MKHIVTMQQQCNLKPPSGHACSECQISCQSACKTSCTVANQKCEAK